MRTNVLDFASQVLFMYGVMFSLPGGLTAFSAGCFVSSILFAGVSVGFSVGNGMKGGDGK